MRKFFLFVAAIAVAMSFTFVYANTEELLKLETTLQHLKEHLSISKMAK